MSEQRLGTNDAASHWMKVNIADFANLTLLGMPPSLESRLEEAVLVSTDDVPPDVVTMLSRVVLSDLATGQRREVVVVYPAEVAAVAGSVSVLEALGMALFGASIGETIEYETREGRSRLRVQEILYQPEHWMRMNLVVRE